MTTALVVGISGDLTIEQAHALQERVERLLPGVVAVVISRCSSLAALTLTDGEA